MEKTYKAANFYSTETDLSVVTPTTPSGTPAVVIGATPRGPAYVPVTVANNDDFPVIITEGGNVFSDNTCVPDTDLRDIVVPWEEAGVAGLPASQGILNALPLLPHSPAVNRRFEPCLETVFLLGVPFEVPLMIDQFDRLRGMFCDAGALGLKNKTYIFYPLIERE